MAQKPETVLKDLKAGKYAPIYFLQGEESFYIDQIANYIENHALTLAEKGFNQTVIYGKEANMKQIMHHAKRFPMMAQRQVVIVKEAQEITDFRTESAKNLLTSYCQKPLPTTVLVFCHKHKKVDSRTKLAKTLAKTSVLVNTKKLYDNQLPAKVVEIFKEKNYKISAKASVIFAEHIGNNLSRLVNEADKLLLNLPEGTEIAEAHIAEHVGISKEFNTFELQDAIGQKNILKVNQIVHFFAQNPKDHPVIPIIALLFGYFSKLLLMHHSADKSKPNLAKKLGVNPYFIDGYLRAGRNYPLSKVVQVISFLRRADLQSKGIQSNRKDDEILKELVFKILHA